MSRFTRISFLLVAVLAVTTTGALANIPSPELSSVPDKITLGLGATFPLKPGVGGSPAVDNPIGSFSVHVAGPAGAVGGSFVEVEIAPDIDGLVAWCVGQTHPVLSGFADGNGDFTFTFQGGGCIVKGSFPHTSFIAQVRADGIVLKEPDISSPDAVNSNGKKPTQSPRSNNCLGGTTAVGLSDAVFHTRPFKLGVREPCSKFSAPFSDPVALLDAVYASPYIKLGRSCTCQ
jgi:hypothetical protein